MLKTSIFFSLALQFFNPASAYVSLNRSETLNAIVNQSRDFSHVICGYCDQKDYDSLNGVCSYSCMDKINCDIKTLNHFQIDSLDTDEAKKWIDESLITVNEEEKSLKKFFESESADKREQSLKKKICGVEAPVLSQLFIFNYPDAEKGEAIDQYAKQRHYMMAMAKVYLQLFYWNQVNPHKSNLSCLKGNLQTDWAQEISGNALKTKIDFSSKDRMSEFFVVRLGDSKELILAQGPLNIKTRIFMSNNSKVYNDYDEIEKVKSSFAYLFQDLGETSEKRRKLELKHLWQVDTLVKHFVFITKGRTIDQSMQHGKLDWMDYMDKNTTVKSEDQDGSKSVKFTLSVDLKGFCKGAEPLYDLTTH